MYVNQGRISPVKGGHAVYLEFVVIGQTMPIANPNPEINMDNHDFKENEVLLFVLLYNKSNGLYQDLTKKLGHLILRGDLNERFCSYGFDE